MVLYKATYLIYEMQSQYCETKSISREQILTQLGTIKVYHISGCRFMTKCSGQYIINNKKKTLTPVLFHNYKTLKNHTKKCLNSKQKWFNPNSRNLCSSALLMQGAKKGVHNISNLLTHWQLTIIVNQAWVMIISYIRFADNLYQCHSFLKDI